jgi:hypothetical protein
MLVVHAISKRSSPWPSTGAPLHSDFNTQPGAANDNDGYDLEKGFSNIAPSGTVSV